MATATRLQFLHQCILKKKKRLQQQPKNQLLTASPRLDIPRTSKHSLLHKATHKETCKHVRTWRMPWTILCVATLGTRGNVTRVNNWSVSTCTFGLWHSEQFTVNLAHTFF